MTTMTDDHRFVLTLSCPDRTGIVAHISSFLADIGGWITEAAYHSDPGSGRFFTRQEIRADSIPFGISDLRRRFGEVAAELAADYWQVADTSNRKKIVLLVSKEGHCLYEILARWHSGELTADITMVIGNRPDLEPVAQMFGLPFRLIPVPKDELGRATAFEQVRAEVDSHAPDAIVLARYMQVIPPELCEAWAGRLINIHHGFLPSFRGARPYHQAYQRGVKMIGATCHYVSAELDAGPIIDQDVVRVDHGDSPADMVRLGRDVEKAVLARGLTYVLQNRVLRDGLRTIVFT
jgi:formyltetrahydrofolate deformylase